MNKTILVLLDACRYDAATRNFGYLEHLIDCGRGAKYKVRGELPSLSRPIYATLLSGLPVHVHGITSNEVVRRLAEENVFSLCRAAGGRTAAAAYHWMCELFDRAPFSPLEGRIRLEGSGAIGSGIYYWEDGYPDSHLFADGEFLRLRCGPDFLLYHPMGIDCAGHQKGSESPEYEQAVMRAGCCLAVLLPAWLEAGWQVVVTADHGMNRYGIHGGTDPEQRDVPLYLFGSRAEPGRFTKEYISQLNVAPLLCRLLGVRPGKEMLPRLEIRFRSEA